MAAGDEEVAPAVGRAGEEGSACARHALPAAPGTGEEAKYKDLAGGGPRRRIPAADNQQAIPYCGELAEEREAEGEEVVSVGELRPVI